MNRLARRARWLSDEHLDERAKTLDALDAAAMAYDLTRAAVLDGMILAGEACEILTAERQTLLACRDLDARGRTLQRDLDDMIGDLGQLPASAIAMLPREALPHDLQLEGMQMALAFDADLRRRHPRVGMVTVGEVMQRREGVA
jgi:hypothetical protein